MRKCARNIDKPLLLFGLEPEDAGVLTAAGGLMMLFMDTFYAGIVFFGGWLVMRMVKQNKPQGYITHLFYKHGLRLKGLIDPPKQVKRYSEFRGEI